MVGPKIIEIVHSGRVPIENILDLSNFLESFNLGLGFKPFLGTIVKNAKVAFALYLSLCT